MADVKKTTSKDVELTYMQRQLPKNNKPALKLREFTVSMIDPRKGEISSVIEATTEADAWAFFCDDRKEFPSPHRVEATVVPV